MEMLIMNGRDFTIRYLGVGPDDFIIQFGRTSISTIYQTINASGYEMHNVCTYLHGVE
jgi:hypothetical protein